VTKTRMVTKERDKREKVRHQLLGGGGDQDRAIHLALMLEVLVVDVDGLPEDKLPQRVEGLDPCRV